MYAHLLLFEKKKRYKKVHFSQFLKDPLQFIKITQLGCINCFEKKIYFHGICALFKKYISFYAFLCVRETLSNLRMAKGIEPRITILKFRKYIQIFAKYPTRSSHQVFITSKTSQRVVKIRLTPVWQYFGIVTCDRFPRIMRL